MRKLMADSCSGRAVQLVYGDENGRLKMDPEAIDALQQLKGSVAVVSLYGRARHVKSFVWNQLLGRSMGFQVGSVHRPCSRGLWVWIAPVKRIAEDDLEYNLVLLDVDSADADDQSHQDILPGYPPFKHVCQLSGKDPIAQMGGINDVALDNLSLLMEISKHEHVGAARDDTVFQLGQFSPIFVWLLMDFNLELVERSSSVTPSDYLESVLELVPWGEQDVAAKNKIRESFRALFPNQEFITLNHPLISETELQHLDQIPLEKLHPQFRSRIDALAKFVFERTRPKQIGGTIVTGPLLAGFTKSFLGNLNNGVVPTISSVWQCVEELECRRAYDMATKVYMSVSERIEAPEEALLIEAHNKAVLKAMTAFDGSAVGTGAARQKYETNLQNFLKKAFEDCKQVIYMEEDSRCCKAIQNMGKKLQTVSHSRDAHIDDVTKVLDTLVADYEVSVHGPRKWQKLSSFLRKSLQDILVSRGEKHTAELLSENSNLMLQHRSMQDTIDLLKKQLEGCEKLKNKYQKRYKDAIDDMQTLSDQYKCRVHDLESKCRSLEDKYSHLVETLEPTRLEAFQWKRKYEETLAEKKGGNASANTDISNLESKSNTVEAGIAAAYDQSIDWKIKYQNAVGEKKVALEKVMVTEESLKQACTREEAMRAEFFRILDDKEKKINDKAGELANTEQQLSALSSKLKNAELKMEKCLLESTDLKLQIRVLDEKYQSAKSAAESFDTKAEALRRGRTELEEKYRSYLEKFEKVCLRLEVAESEALTAKELVNSMRAEAQAARNKENKLQKSLREKCIDIDREKIRFDNLEKQKMELVGEVESCRLANQATESKIALLETRMKEKEEEIAALKRINTTQKENASEMHVNSRKEYSCTFSGEVAEDSNPQPPQGKRSRHEAAGSGSGSDSVQEMDTAEDTVTQARKKLKKPATPSKCTATKAGSSSAVSHTKYTIKMLRNEITKQGFGAELLQLKSPKKKDLLDLYERCVLHK